MYTDRSPHVLCLQVLVSLEHVDWTAHSVDTDARRFLRQRVTDFAPPRRYAKRYFEDGAPSRALPGECQKWDTPGLQEAHPLSQL